MPPKFAARPSGGSVFSDVAGAGAGFLTGLKQEKEKEQAAKIAQAMRQFEQRVQTEKLGLDQQQVNLAEQNLIRQRDNDAAEAADREIARKQAQQQINISKEQQASLAEDRKQEMAFRNRQLLQQADEAEKNRRLERELKRYDIADRHNKSAMSDLNTLNDNLNAAETRLLADKDLIGVKYNRVKAKNELRATIENPKADKNSLQYQEAATKYQKLLELDEIERQRKEVLNRQARLVQEGSALSRESGGVVPAPPPSARRWDEYSPQEKQEFLQNAVGKVQAELQTTGKEPDYEPLSDLGMTDAEIEYIRDQALQQLAPPPPARPVPLNPQGGFGEAGLIPMQVPPSPVLATPPVAPGVTPTTHISPPMSPRPDTSSLLRQNPDMAGSNRAPILQGPSIRPPIISDPTRHRIIRPRPIY